MNYCFSETCDLVVVTVPMKKMSEFNKNKLNKKRFECRSQFLLRLAQRNVQEINETAGVS